MGKYTDLVPLPPLCRYAKRLRTLRVLEAEIRMTFKASATAPEMPVRFVVSCESGYYIHMHMYHEETNGGGDPTYQSLGPAGPLHGTPPWTLYSLFSPHFRLYEVVSLHMCVLPYKYRKISEMLPIYQSLGPAGPLHGTEPLPISYHIFRLYEVVPLHLCVLPYNYRTLLEMLPKLMKTCQLK